MMVANANSQGNFCTIQSTLSASSNISQIGSALQRSISVMMTSDATGAGIEEATGANGVASANGCEDDECAATMEHVEGEILSSFESDEFQGHLGDLNEKISAIIQTVNKGTHEALAADVTMAEDPATARAAKRARQA